MKFQITFDKGDEFLVRFISEDENGKLTGHQDFRFDSYTLTNLAHEILTALSFGFRCMEEIDG